MAHSQPTGVTIAPDADAKLAAMLARAEAAEAQVAALRIANNGKLTVKQSAKGAVSVYGLQRWPVTLYREQWERLNAAMPQVLAFIKANTGTLAVKADKQQA